MHSSCGDKNKNNWQEKVGPQLADKEPLKTPRLQRIDRQIDSWEIGDTFSEMAEGCKCVDLKQVLYFVPAVRCTKIKRGLFSPSLSHM